MDWETYDIVAVIVRGWSWSEWLGKTRVSVSLALEQKRCS